MRENSKNQSGITKQVLVILGCFLLFVVLGFFVFSNGFSTSGKAIAQDNEIKLTSKEIKSLAMRFPFFDELPENAVLVFSFYDGNGIARSGGDYTLYGNGTVRRFLPSDFDLRLITGDYNFVMLKQSSDLCESLQLIAKNKDFKIERGKTIPVLLLKYKDLVPHKDCLGLD